MRWIRHSATTTRRVITHTTVAWILPISGRVPTGNLKFVLCTPTCSARGGVGGAPDGGELKYFFFKKNVANAEKALHPSAFGQGSRQKSTMLISQKCFFKIGFPPQKYFLPVIFASLLLLLPVNDHHIFCLLLSQQMTAECVSIQRIVG